VEGGNKSTSSAILAALSNVELLGATAHSDSSLALVQRMLPLVMDEVMNEGGCKTIQVGRLLLLMKLSAAGRLMCGSLLAPHCCLLAAGC
jgi:hypothetical protein